MGDSHGPGEEPQAGVWQAAPEQPFACSSPESSSAGAWGLSQLGLPTGCLGPQRLP